MLGWRRDKSRLYKQVHCVIVDGILTFGNVIRSMKRNNDYT